MAMVAREPPALQDVTRHNTAAKNTTKQAAEHGHARRLFAFAFIVIAQSETRNLGRRRTTSLGGVRSDEDRGDDWPLPRRTVARVPDGSSRAGPARGTGAGAVSSEGSGIHHDYPEVDCSCCSKSGLGALE